MNADGSSGVRVTGTVGATVPSLTGLAWGLLLVGALITAVGVLLIVLAARRGGRRPAPSADYPSTPAPGGPPPAWALPAPRESADGTPARPVQP
jgi:hypothetical protein